jgi:transcription elongation factor Elf1
VLKEMWGQLGRHPIELGAGLMLAVVGVMLTVSGTQPGGGTYKLYFGGLATTFGGVLLSWTVSKAISRSEALQEIRSQLDLVSKTLGQAAGQISRVVDQCNDHSLNADTGFAMVGQQAQVVGAQVSAIQGILGNPFETAELLTTITEVERLAEKLDRKERGAATVQTESAVENTVAAVKNRLHEMREQLAGPRTTSARVSEIADCPVCGKEQSVSIGAYPGDTASNFCTNCGRSFNVHRRSDGSIFTRTRGSGPSGGGPPTNESETPRLPEYLEGQCPSCNEEVRIKAPATKTHKFAVCLNCASTVIFNPSGAVTSDGQYEKLGGLIVSRSGSSGSASVSPIFYCDKCSRQIRSFIRKGNMFYGIDDLCRRLHASSDEEFVAWRQKNEPETLPTGTGSANKAGHATDSQGAPPNGSSSV